MTGGGSDANALAVQGIECVNLANGTEHNHEPSERVSVPRWRGCSTSASRCSTRPAERLP